MCDHLTCVLDLKNPIEKRGTAVQTHVERSNLSREGGTHDMSADTAKTDDDDVYPGYK